MVIRCNLQFAKYYRPAQTMVALYKLLITLTSLILLLASDSVDSTWDDAEGGSIPVPVDTLSWLQVSVCDNFRL